MAILCKKVQPNKEQINLKKILSCKRERERERCKIEREFLT